MPQLPTSSKKLTVSATKPRSPYNRSPYRERTVAVRVPESMLPQVRKMLSRRRDQTARHVNVEVKAKPKLSPKRKLMGNVTAQRKDRR
ncbi:hypothetical protein FFI97_019335 [Variovorax sp. KBS0712]|uniref:hypothetical protein n=1 Tax=Variovorax sp. KBS0712 TaxID=2578111 RepID=UPI00111B7929|nr:hypothetical protein [Variovorax sp. KBS0712]TSD56390.1 hypothetical protein FFI97_019335 [Variovorax sp. KBS0712]